MALDMTLGGGGNEDEKLDDLAAIWKQRITAADKYHLQWESEMACVKMEEYYRGKQWQDTGLNPSYERYVLNLIYTTIEIKLPTLLFDIPVFHIKPRPRRGAFDLESAIQRSLLREDLLNTIVSDPELRFPKNASLAIKDAFFRFGIVEVGYSANWVENPNAGMPILKSDESPVVDTDGNTVKEPKQLPQSERIYVRRIPAKHFRVGGVDGIGLSDSNWCGYASWYRPEDLKANKNLINVDKIEWAGGRTPDFYPDGMGKTYVHDESNKTGDISKVWTIYDNRSKQKIMLHDATGIVLFKKPFTRLPLFDLRFSPLFEGFYPMPPVKSWKMPQDEINDSKEQARNHRKRYVRKFVYNKAALPNIEEVDKLINGPDGTFVGAEGGDIERVVFPVPNADLGASARDALVTSKDDFNIASATSEEQRGQSDRTTATQANIINQKAQVRDSSSRVQVATWLAEIGREVLLLAEEKYTLPVWLKMLADPGAPGDNVSELTEIWHQVKMEDFKTKDGEDDLDFDVAISVDSLSPITNDEEKTKFLEFLAVLNQYPELSMDPLLIREAAYRIGYRNEKVIVRMQVAAQQMLVNKMAAQNGGGAGTAGTSQLGQATVAQQTPPGMSEVQNQIHAQVTGGQK
jgi:hypothetical protein